MKPADSSASSEEDRRSEARLSPGDVECDIEGARFVHVLGLTLGGHGMRVLTDAKLPTDADVPITLHLSDRESLVFTGRVMWEKDQDLDFTRRYISGIKFVEPDSAASARLHHFVEEFLAREHPESKGHDTP